MAKQKKQTTFLDEEIDLQQQYGKVEQFIEEHKTKIMGIVGLVSVVILSFFAFKSVYLPGQEKDAQRDMFTAQEYFQADSFQLALDGNSTKPGFLDVIDSYNGMTKAVNLAHYYAGISFLNLGKFEEAIDHLSSFSGDDEVVSSMALGAMGDAYMELGETSNGISYYKKAANNSDNEFTGAMYLMRAAAANEVEGNHGEAKKLYQKIKDKYPESSQAQTIDKYIDRVAAKL